VLEYILAGIIHNTSISPNTTKKIAAVKPMATAIGSPIIIRKIKTPKMAAVIMAFSSPTSYRYLIDDSPLPSFNKGGRGEFGNGFYKFSIDLTSFSPDLHTS
jgi:hypothetical protein